MVMLDSTVQDAVIREVAMVTTETVVDDGPITLQWESVEGVEPAAWVGRVRGSFVGMIEARWQEGFTATTRLGRKLGTFGTLEDAQGAFIVRRH